MPNYKETAISTGSSWTRARQVYIDNPLNGIRSITFVEELVVSTDGETIAKPTNLIKEDFSNPATEFNLLNPIDGSVLGTATYMDIYVMLYSLYMKIAADRDAGIISNL